MNMPILTHLSRSVLLLLVITFGLAWADDQPQLQQVKHTTLSAAEEQITLHLNGSYSPKIFTLKGESPRVVFDFAGMTQGKGISNTITVNGPMVKTIRVGMHSDPAPKTRVVFDLKSLKGVNFSQNFNDKNSTLTIRFTGPEKAVAASKKAPQQKKEPETTASPAPQKQAPREQKTGTPIAQSLPSVEKSPPEQAAPVTPPQPEQPKPVAASTPPTSPLAADTDQRTAKPTKEEQAKEQPPAPVSTTALEENHTDSDQKAQKATEKVPAQVADKKQAEATVTEGPTAQSEASSPKPQPTAAPEEVPPPNADPALESIKFDPSSPKGEMVMFKLNGFHPPSVHGVEEGIPRVICDFNNTKMTGTTKRLIKTDGKYVRAIRTSKTKKPEKIRVVIDLEPNRSYDLQQVFFKDDNLFVIIVNTIKK